MRMAITTHTAATEMAMTAVEERDAFALELELGTVLEEEVGLIEV